MLPAYQTQNRALAITLATCGVRFVRDEKRGVDVPFVHIYSEAILRKMKDGRGEPRFKGLPFQKAALAAFRAGLRGMLVYNFIRDEVCERVIKAYNQASTAIEAADAAGAPAGLTLNITVEDAATLCAQFTKNRNTFTHGWKTARPYLHLPGASQQHSEGGKTVTIGSFRLVPLNLAS